MIFKGEKINKECPKCGHDKVWTLKAHTRDYRCVKCKHPFDEEDLKDS